MSSDRAVEWATAAQCRSYSVRICDWPVTRIGFRPCPGLEMRMSHKSKTPTELLRESIGEIMTRWEQRAVKEVGAAFNQTSLVLS